MTQDVPRLDEEGLSADEIQLRAQGHVGELPRQFSPLATLALAFSITNRYVGIDMCLRCQSMTDC